METISVKNWKLIVVTALISCFTFVDEANAQSALGQLETMAGQKVDYSQVPPPNCVCTECHYPCGSGHSSSCPYSNGEVRTTTTSTDRNLTYRKEKANKLNDNGNSSFRSGNYRDAVSSYKRARFFNPFDETIKQNYKAAKRALDAKKREEKLAHQKPKPKPKPISSNVNNTSIANSHIPQTNVNTANNSQYNINTSQNTTVTSSTTNIAPTYIPPIKDVKQYGQMYVAQSKLFNTLIDYEIIDADNPYIKVSEGIMNNPSVLVYTEDFQKEEEKRHPEIEYYRKLSVASVGLLPKGINYGMIVGTNLIFKSVSAGVDVLSGTGRSEYHEAQIYSFVNALKQSEFDVAMAASTDVLVGNGIKLAGAGIVKASEGAAVTLNNTFSVIAPNLAKEAGSVIMSSGRNVSELVLSKTAENATQILGLHKDFEDAREDLIKNYNQEQK